MMTEKQIARELQFMTEVEARAIEMAPVMTEVELNRAYARASLCGEGRVCEVLLNEMDRRSARQHRAA